MSEQSEYVPRFERAKLLHDYFKHLTSVSTAAVVFMVTFQKEFPNNDARYFIVASIVAFFACIICAVGAQSAYIWYASSKPRRIGKIMYRIGRTGCWMAFGFAMFFLTAFAVKGLLDPEATKKPDSASKAPTAALSYPAPASGGGAR
jgi:hypothetical protein